jgi:putative polyketide hydroxylase
MPEERVPALIVGAGGAGLSLSLLLQQQGIRSLVVERRSDVSWYPRARNLNFRTLEVFRGLGLASQIRAASAPVSRVFQRERLASPDEKELLDPASLLDATTVSPEPALRYCPQSRTEPILLAAARARGVDIRYNTELDAFSQDDQGVTATVNDRATGRSSVIQADYLVGADGAHSRVRRSLGIQTQGQGVLDEHYLFVYFRADWDQFVRGYESDVFLVENSDVRGMFFVGEKNLGMFILTYYPSQGQSSEAYTRERCQQLIEYAIGRPDIGVDVVEIAQWQPAQLVADRFQRGRVFLVGDAAHTMPPKEGLGLNTAVQSAQNLAWKLAAVMHGQAGTSLLSTYTVERRPVGWFAAQHSLTGPGAALLEQIPEQQKRSEFFPIVGYRYCSTAIVAEGDSAVTSPGEITLLDREELTGQPGTRVPHVWLEHESQRISTLDLLDGGFVLLTGNRGTMWIDAVSQVAAATGVKLAAYRVGANADLIDINRNWAARMGIAPDGAILIRPDGFVAWRTCHTETLAPPTTTLKQVLLQILSRCSYP